MTTSTPTKIERAVMSMLLVGEHPVLDILRRQFELCTIAKREFTGAGVFVTFSVPETAPRLPQRDSFSFGDVSADIQGLQHGAGFVLWVREGVLDFLEGYTYDELWPDQADAFSLQYDHSPRDLHTLLGGR
jgi:hypothetical protein